VSETDLNFYYNPDWYYFPISELTQKPLKGWQKVSTNDINKIKEWKQRWPKCLMGLDTGKSRLVVIDVDNKNGKVGDNVLADLQLENGVLPKSFTVKTPSGGRHLYFQGQTKNRVGLHAPGIDVRSVGGYVIAPGVVKQGKPYQVEVNQMPVLPPGWLVEMIGRPNERKEESQVPLIELDLPHNVQKAMDWLRQEAPIAEMGSRDATCYKVACRIRDFGVSHEVAQDLMQTIYADKIDWSDDFDTGMMLTKVRSAYNYANDRPGNDTAEAATLRAAEAFGELTGEDLPAGEEFEEALPASSWVHISQFSERKAPDREWIVENWLPAGFSTPTLITGDGGTGKSLLAMQLAISVATGEPWVGLEVSRTMQVAMIMCEDSEDELHRRVEKIKSSKIGAFTDLGRANINFMSRVGKDCVMCREDNGVLKDGPFMLELHQQLKHLGTSEKLLIIDTAADIYAGNESNRTSVTHFIKYKLCGLAKLHNATIIIIAHPPKSGATYSGSTAWNNSVRNRLYLSWQNDKDKNDWRVLSVEKSNYSQAGTTRLLKWSNGILDYIDQATLGVVVDDLVYDEIVRFNREADEQGIDRRLSARRNAKNCIFRQKIHDPKTGRRLTPTEIREAIARLTAENRIGEIYGRRSGNGLVCLKQFEEE